MDERKDYGTSDHPMTKAESDAQPKAMPASVFPGHVVPGRETPNEKSPYPHHWTEAFAGRELEEIKFARTYHQCYGHGTPGHLHLLIISQLSRQVDILMGRDPNWDRANW